MPNLRELSEAERQTLWDEMRAEFPDDEMMQEVHFARALHTLQFQDLTRDERIAYLNRFVPQTASQTA